MTHPHFGKLNMRFIIYCPTYMSRKFKVLECDHLQYNIMHFSSLTDETLTRVHANDEATDDEHLKGLCHLTQGQQQSSYYSKAIIYK